MNEDKTKNEYELSPAEEAALDRLLRETADADSAELRADEIHDAIIKKAREQGIYVFSAKKKAAPAKKRNGLARSLWTGAAAAAAVFVIGFAVFAVIRSIGPANTDNRTAYSDTNTRNTEASVPAETVRDADPAATLAPEITPDMTITDGPAQPTADPVRIELLTPLPTEYPMRGGVAGYTLLAPFTANAEDTAELLPQLLPEDMETFFSETELSVTAVGKADGKDLCYKCRVLTAEDDDADMTLGVSVARYSTDFAGILRYTWRVTEDRWLDVVFIGFEREEADAILMSLPLCDCEAVAEVYSEAA